jgi:hypothetical protein
MIFDALTQYYSSVIRLERKGGAMQLILRSVFLSSKQSSERTDRQPFHPCLVVVVR